MEEDKTLIKGPRGEDIYREDYMDEWGNVTKDGKVLAACGDWVDINPWKSEEIANAPMDQWFSMDEVWKIKKKLKYIGKYWINKRGQVKAIIRPWAKSEEKKWKYWNLEDFPIRKNKGKKYQCLSSTSLPISVIYAIMFLKNDNPESKIIVDHINGDSLNNSRINIRWASYSENSKNIAKYDRDYTREIWFAKFVDNGELVEWVFISNLDKKLRRELIKEIKTNKSPRVYYKGFYWEKYTGISKKYVTQFGLPDPNEWKISKDFSNLLGNPVGCILDLDSRDCTISVGRLSVEGYYKTDKYGAISRLVWCICKEKSLKDIRGLEIDHLNTNSIDNRLINLSEGTHEDNMNNPKTKEKRTKRISQIEPETGKIIKIFNSLTEAAQSMSSARTSISSISEAISNTSSTLYGYLWSYEGEEEKKWKEYINYLENCKEKNYPDWWWKNKDHRRKVAITCSTISQYRNNYPKAYEISSSIVGEIEEYNLKEGNKPKGYWDIKENWIEEAKKYKTRKEFENNCRKALKVAEARHKDWIKEYFPPKEKMTKEKAKEIALKYKTRTEFKNSKDRNAHTFAVKHNLLDEFFPKTNKNNNSN